MPRWVFSSTTHRLYICPDDEKEISSHPFLFGKRVLMNTCILQGDCKYSPLPCCYEYSSTFENRLWPFSIQRSMLFVSNPDSYRDYSYDDLQHFRSEIAGAGDFFADHV